MKVYRLYIQILPFLFFVGCASGVRPRSLSVGHDATLSVKGEVVKELKANETIELPEGASLIEAPGHISVMLFPLESDNSAIKMELPRLDAKRLDDATTDILRTNIDQLLKQVSEIYKLMSLGEYQTALKKTQTLKQNYPQQSVISFLEASCYILVGNKKMARISLEEGLMLNPDDADARKMYRSLLPTDDRGILNRLEKDSKR